MKVSKERRQLCDDVTNSHKIEAKKRREEYIEDRVNTMFIYLFLMFSTSFLIFEIIRFIMDMVN